MCSAAYISPPVHAYVIPSGDAHQSEYIASCDERRAFISGFTGSAGTAIVTETKAAMWTDGRYYLQACAQMDDNWVLMKDGLPDTPTQGEWLCEVLPANGRVGVDPFLLSADAWKTLRKKLKSDGHVLIPIEKDLVDAVWDDRPPRPVNPVMVQPLQWSGKEWPKKVSEVREKMSEKKAVGLIVTALDEIAWLLNLRGSDISYNPVFFAFVIVTTDSVMLFIDSQKLSDSINAHLTSEKMSVTVLPYSEVATHLASLVFQVADGTGKIWISDKSSYALCDMVPKLRRVNDRSPIALMKSIKNDVEIAGMRSAHIKDAVALCEFFLWLEKEAPKGTLTEVSAAEYAETVRKEQNDYVSLSFHTISAVGANAAINHYCPSAETDKVITLDQLYLLDSGAQFRDGTTDVTRTLHLGNPTDFEKECYTRVLKGHIALARLIFPPVKGYLLDSFARQHLWQIGLDYLHGTGHGVGSFLNVHEGPCHIGTRALSDTVPLEKGMILSDEPGYYEDGQFGIRIENLVLVIEADTPHRFKDKCFMTFEPLTLVPLQTKLIVKDLLTAEELAWINNYHKKCRDVIGPELEKSGRQDALRWLQRETEPLI